MTFTCSVFCGEILLLVKTNTTILTNIIFMLTNAALYKLLNGGCYSGLYMNVILYFVASRSMMVWGTAIRVFSGVYK